MGKIRMPVCPELIFLDTNSTYFDKTNTSKVVAKEVETPASNTNNADTIFSKVSGAEVSEMAWYNAQLMGDNLTLANVYFGVS